MLRSFSGNQGHHHPRNWHYCCFLSQRSPPGAYEGRYLLPIESFPRRDGGLGRMLLNFAQVHRYAKWKVDQDFG
jgi:hypothetical protein